MHTDSGIVSRYLKPGGFENLMYIEDVKNKKENEVYSKKMMIAKAKYYRDRNGINKHIEDSK